MVGSMTSVPKSARFFKQSIHSIQKLIVPCDSHAKNSRSSQIQLHTANHKGMQI